MSNFQKNMYTDFIVFNKIHPQAKKLQPIYYQIGLICSVQALPEIIDLELWLPCLWRDGVDISFDNQQQASEYARTVLKMANDIQALYQESLPLQDLDCETWLDCHKNANDKGVQFAKGFLAGIEIFNAQWSVADEDINTQNLLQTAILLLSKIAPTEEIDEALLAIFDQLPKVSEIMTVLPLLLTNLAVNAAQNTEGNNV